MMRPTASSAQKTHDKVQPITPPKTRTKTMGPPKAKQSTTQEPPPKMQLGASKESETENKEKQEDHLQPHDPNAIPDVAYASPFDGLKQDPPNVDAEKEPHALEPTATADHEKVNGDAQEVY